MIDLKFDFNDPPIVQAHLRQALPQMDMQDVSDRIVVDPKRGGLVYKLFPDPTLFQLNSHWILKKKEMHPDHFGSVFRIILTML